MFQSIAAAVDWSAVYLALAQVAIMVAGLWVVIRGTTAILRFVLSSDDRGGGSDGYWDGYTAEDDAADRAAEVRWESDDSHPMGGYFVDVAPAGGVEFIEAQSAGSTGSTLDPLDPDSPEYIGDAWVDESSADWVPPPLTEDEEEANQREADRMIGWREKEDW